MKYRLLYKVLSIVWLFFGVVFLLLPILGNGSKRSIILGIVAAILFLINSYLNCKRYKNYDLIGEDNEE